MRRASTIAATLAAASLGGPAPTGAQEVVPALIGGAAGLAAGGYVSIGIWTAKARYSDEYLFAARDALGWEAVPVLVGAGTGAALGFWDRHRLQRTVIGGAAGWFVGTGIGMTLGASAWAPPEGRWAGGVIGGAAGILVGSVVGALWPGSGEDETTGESAESRSPGIPIVITIRF